MKDGNVKLCWKMVSMNGLSFRKTKWKNFNRVQYQLLKRLIRKGDVLYIHSLVVEIKKRSSRNGMTSQKIFKQISW